MTRPDWTFADVKALNRGHRSSLKRRGRFYVDPEPVAGRTLEIVGEHQRALERLSPEAKALLARGSGQRYSSPQEPSTAGATSTGESPRGEAVAAKQLKLL